MKKKHYAAGIPEDKDKIFVFRFFPYLFVFFMVFFPFAEKSFSQPSWYWAAAAGGSYDDEGFTTATDDSGNVIVAGHFKSSSITFGATVLTNAAANYFDILIVKYDKSGNVIWAKRAGGTTDDFAQGVACDDTGNVFVAGYFSSPSITFSSVTLTNSGLGDVYLVKYDKSGNVKWAKKSGGAADDGANKVAVDNSGNVLITGWFQSSSITFGAVTLTNASTDADIFLAKYDGAGNTLWAVRAGNTGTESAYNITTDNNGNVFITGWFSSTSITFGSTTLSNNYFITTYPDIFLAKYNSSGTVQWAKSIGGTDSDIGNAVKTDNNGNVFLIGNFQSSSVTVGSTNWGNYSTYRDIIIVKYDASGNVVWSDSPGGTGDDVGFDIAIDASGYVYCTGYYNSSTCYFGSYSVTTSGVMDIFIVQYNNSGTVQWVKKTGGTGNDYGTGISINSSCKYIHLSGSFYSSSISLGTNTLTNSFTAYTNYFVATLSSLKLTPGQVSVSCNGGSNGSATVTAAWGTTPYSYLWGTTPAQSSSAATGLPAGTYSVTVNDQVGCVASDKSTVTQPTVLTSSIAYYNASCTADSLWKLDLTPSGGTSPYTYSWTDTSASVLGTSQDIDSLNYGTYFLDMSDSKGCNRKDTVMVTLPASFVLGISVVTDVKCSGANTGIIDFAVSGGITPYTYLWSNSATTENLNNIAAGTYSVTAWDRSSCQLHDTFTVSQPTALVSSISVTPVLCSADSSGSANLSVTGGTPPYTFAWSNGATTEDVTGALSAGNNTVAIRDSNNCLLNDTAVIGILDQITLTVTKTNVSCNGGNSGSAAVTVSGGAAPLTYAWSNGGTSSAVSNLAANTYTVTVSDTNGCFTASSAVITQPSVLAVSVTKTNATCSGLCNASATATASGGTSPYTYAWSGGGTASNKTGLCAGSINITVTDNKGCTAAASATVTQPAALSASINQTDVNCFGGNDGSATVSTTGGTANVTASTTENWESANTWTLVNGTQTNQWYIGTATANGGTKSIYVSDNASANNYNISLSSVVHFYKDFTFPAGVTGITIQFDWKGYGESTFDYLKVYLAPTSVTPVSATQVSSSYQIGLTYYNLQSAFITASITGLDANAGSTKRLIFSWINDASVGTQPPAALDNIVVSYLSTGYNYSWNTSPGQTTSTATALSAGNYSVTITDFYGCTASSSATITEPSAALAMSVITSNASCDNSCDGSASATCSGGTPPYNFLWSDSQSSSSATGLCMGSYFITATDSKGCSANTPALISTAAPINISLTTADEVCGNSNGSATVSATGGTGSLSYSWSNGSSGTEITGLSAGTYFMTVTDSSGCFATDTAIILNTPPPTLTVTYSNPSCSGSADGRVTAGVSGGSSPYTYQWNNGAASSGIINLSPGMYSVTVSDTNSCASVDSVNLTEPVSLSLTISSQDITSCGGSNGSANVAVTGGTGSYTYQWSNGQTASSVSGLSAGVYSVIVTDQNGCARQEAVSISGYSGNLALSLNTADVTCHGENDGTASVNVSGGTSPYTYFWNTGSGSQNEVSLPAGTYTVTVTDGANCTGYAVAVITEPDVISVSFTGIVNPACGNANGTATASVQGGTPPYHYVWSNNDTLPASGNLKAGINFIMITDVNGCISYGTLSLSNNSGLLLTYSKTDIQCHGGNNGSINLNVSGGSQPYTYNWSNGGTTSNLIALPGGIYEVAVTDADSCVVSESIEINEPSSLSIEVTKEDASCGIPDGKAQANISGGTPPYSIAWSTGSTGTSLTGLNAGTYSIAVSDSNGCLTTNIITIAISNIGGPFIANDSTGDVYCGSSAGGFIDVSISGGHGGNSYLWSTAATTEDISGLAAGQYSLTVTDSLGCKGVAVFDVLNALPAAEPICIVSVDSATQRNLIVWDNSLASPGTAEFRIYKEGTTMGVYNFLAPVPVTAPAEYTDLLANPAQRSWRYRITAVDSCGSESEFSEIHKTMHLSVALGVGGKIELIWDPYEGFYYTTYIIYRGITFGQLDSIDALPANISSYTDLTPPQAPEVYYSVAAVKTSPCIVLQKIKKYNSSKSNTALQEMPVGINEHAFSEGGIYIYPNPHRNEVTVSYFLETPKTVSVEIFNVLGLKIKTLVAGELQSEGNHLYRFSMDIPGVYLLKYTDFQKTTFQSMVKVR